METILNECRTNADWTVLPLELSWVELSTPRPAKTPLQLLLFSNLTCTSRACFCTSRDFTSARCISRPRLFDFLSLQLLPRPTYFNPPPFLLPTNIIWRHRYTRYLGSRYTWIFHFSNLTVSFSYDPCMFSETVLWDSNLLFLLCPISPDLLDLPGDMSNSVFLFLHNFWLYM